MWAGCGVQILLTGVLVILTGQLEEGGDGFLPPLGVLGDEGQLHQAQQEDELARRQSYGGHQVTGPHHVELHCRRGGGGLGLDPEHLTEVMTLLRSN